MVLKKVNNLIVIIIILCSTSFYQLSVLGPVQKVIELTGVGIIVFFIILHAVYSEKKSIPHNFILPIALIFLALITSTFMANYSRNQAIWQTLYAQRAIYYYLLYFLLHQMKIKEKDLEIIFWSLGIIYVILYMIQYFLYPTIIYDCYVRLDRGTVRIYLYGSAYFGIAFFMAIQYFFRTNNIKYLLLLFVFFIIYMLTGGRLMLFVSLFITVLFLLLDRKVKSRFFLTILMIIAFALFAMIFQGIIDSIMAQSQKDVGKGDDYIRILAARYFLTDFFKHPLAYITGNGMYYNNSEYGKSLLNIVKNDHFNLSDIGIIGQYAIYGIFFVTGILLLIFRSLRMKIEAKYIYIKYMYISVILVLLVAPSFVGADFIGCIMCVTYLIDVSNYRIKYNIDAST